jgi:hypothetical protein
MKDQWHVAGGHRDAEMAIDSPCLASIRLRAISGLLLPAVAHVLLWTEVLVRSAPPLRATFLECQPALSSRLPLSLPF